MHVPATVTPRGTKVEDALVRLPELQRSAPSWSSAAANVQAVFTYTPPVQLADGVHVRVPPVPPSDRMAPFENGLVLSAAVPVGLTATIGVAKLLPFTVPIVTVPVEVTKVKVKEPLKATLGVPVKVIAAVLYAPTKPDVRSSRNRLRAGHTRSKWCAHR